MSPASSAGTVHPVFQLALPAGWRDRSVYTFTGPVQHGVRHALTIEVDEHGGKDGLDALVAARVPGLRAALANAELLKDARDVLAGGGEVHELIARQWTPDGDPMLVRRVFLVQGAAGLVFTATYTKWTARTYGTQIDAMIASFRWMG